MKKLALLLSTLVMGCNANVVVSAEGRPCDAANLCPDGFACTVGRCASLGGVGGGTAGGTGGNGGGLAGGEGGGTTNLCQGVTCTQVPASTCADANTLRTFIGTCDSTTGQCSYPGTDTTCAQGCLNGACIGDPCAGKVCNMPPAASCLNPTTLRVYAQAGTCSAGTCQYTPMDQTCANGCDMNMCRNQDLCMGVTCTMPPAPMCAGNTLITGGAGTCMNGTCSYMTVSTPCPTGCMNGACVVTAGLTFSPILPRVPMKVTGVDVRPGSGGDDVLAVGNAGQVYRWNGTQWSKVTSNTSANLTGVWFNGSNTALIIGENRTLLSYSNITGTITPFTPALPSSGSAGRLVDVHGGGLNSVVTAEPGGTIFRLGGLGTWSTETRATNAPYTFNSVWVNSAGAIRVGGRANGQGAVVYSSSGTNWFDDRDATTPAGFTSVGPTLNDSSSYGWAGKASAIRRHNGPSTPAFDSAGVPPLLTGGDVFRIVEASSGTRAIYLATTSVLDGSGNATDPGHLYRYTSGGTDELLDLWGSSQVMSRNEATGVVVADNNLGATAATIMQRSSGTTNIATDLGEDWVSVSSNAGGTQLLVNAYGDVATRVTGSNVFQFRRGLEDPTYDGVLASNFGVTVGEAGSTMVRFNISPAQGVPSGFTAVTVTPAPQRLSAICRVSDTEFYAVGTAGAIFAFNGTSAAAMASGSTSGLNDVHCIGPGQAVACGNNATLLRLSGGAWAPVPGGPSAALTSCRQSGNALYVAGNNVFAKLENGTWSTLPARANLANLVVLGPGEVYATSGNEVVRFDGSNWVGRLTASQPLSNGEQIGSRVVFVGTGGVAVEGQ